MNFAFHHRHNEVIIQEVYSNDFLIEYAAMMPMWTMEWKKNIILGNEFRKKNLK